MGTNYYHRTNICDHCERYDSLHIGKSSGGWTFGFRGYVPFDEWDTETPDISSWADWLKRLEAGGKIFDEYGKEMKLEDFKGLVESQKSEPNNHTIYCRTKHPRHAQEDCWLDDEGHSFDKSEFS